jgi:hypothetical protein
MIPLRLTPKSAGSLRDAYLQPPSKQQCFGVIHSLGATTHTSKAAYHPDTKLVDERLENMCD